MTQLCIYICEYVYTGTHIRRKMHSDCEGGEERERGEREKNTYSYLIEHAPRPIMHNFYNFEENQSF